MVEIRIVNPGKIRGYSYPVCKKTLFTYTAYISTGYLCSQTSGPSCSKLMTTFDNVMLKFHMFLSETRQYFC